MYDLNYTAIVGGVIDGFDEAQRISCRNGWEFDTDQIPSSIVIDVILVLL